MKIGSAFENQVLALFQYSDFRDKTEGTIKGILTGNHPKSSMSLLPQPDDIECEDIDELSTKVTFSWSDYSFSFTMKWRKGGKGNNYILENVM